MSDIQKFEFQPEHDGTVPLETAVFQALGAASACWTNLAGAGVFESERAEAIGQALIARINELALDARPGDQRMTFAWYHYGQGHRYWVSDSAVYCECGESCAG